MSNVLTTPTTQLPGLNYNVPLSIDDLQFLQTTYSDEFATRMQLFMALYAGTYYGIVDTANPAAVSASETTRPLIVTIDPTNNLQVDIQAGMAVTQSGFVVTLPTKLNQFTLANTAIGEVNVVFIEYSLISSATTRLSRYNQNLPVSTVVNPSVINSLTLTDFQNPVIMPPTRLVNVVPLAFVTVVQGTSGAQLSVDLGQTNQPTNRTWFTPVDIQHRSYLGSGVQTENNPHAIGLNDLSSGGLTLYQQNLRRGMIISKDAAVANVPGVQLCQETITPVQIQTDSTGLITAGSLYGGIGAKYIRAALYPTRLGSAFWTSTPGVSVAFDFVPHTNIIVFPPSEVLPVSDSITVQYTAAPALMPPADPTVNLLTFTQPTPKTELVITGGLAYTTFANPTINFESTGPIPVNFDVYVDGTGTIVSSPQILQSTITLTDVGTSIYQVSNTMYNAAKIKIGLTRAATSPTMAITIQLVGTDSGGSVISEQVTFSGATWQDSTPPASYNPNQFVTSVNEYYTLSTFQVISRVNDGSNSTIIIYADLQPITSPGLNELSRICKVYWDGLAVNNVLDYRDINLDASIPSRVTTQQLAAESSLATNMLLAQITTPSLPDQRSVLLFADDFRNPRYLDFGTASGSAVAATGFINVINPAGFNQNDTITLRPVGWPGGSRVLVAKLTGANPALGQFNFGGLLGPQVASNIVNTVNNATFNVDMTAVVDGTNASQVDLTASNLGAQGNGLITAALVLPASIGYGGMIGGVDAIGPAILGKYDDGLVSAYVPSPSLYDDSAYTSRYRSFAIAVPQYLTATANIMIILYGVKKPSGLQQGSIRVRAVYANDPNKAWQPSVVLNLPSLSDQLSFPVTFPNPIYKLQVTVYGEATGIAVYMTTPNT